MADSAQLDHSHPETLSYQHHRRLIGYLGIALPVVIVLIAGIRPTTSLPGWETLDSVSAYYYTGAVAAFIGTLGALALFLYTYRGYSDSPADRVAGKLGGLFAAGVALFPTAAPGQVAVASWWNTIIGTIHYVSATLLFLVFIVFSLWLFRKTNVPAGEPLPPGKLWRNRVYLACGLVMVASVLWAGSSYFTGAPIFWPEAIALWAFAVSWLVKGDAHRPVVDRVRRAIGP